MRDRDLDRRGRVREITLHDGFLRHKGFRWLKIALLLSIAVTAGYFFADVKPRPNGGSWRRVARRSGGSVWSWSRCAHSCALYCR